MAEQDYNPKANPYSEEFDWFDFLQQDFNRPNLGPALDKANELASDWVTCATGQLCKSLPRNKHGGPEDYALDKYGMQFYRKISMLRHSYKFMPGATWEAARDELRKSALAILGDIEKRTGELLSGVTDEKTRRVIVDKEQS